jgi:alkylated DNA repair dioxygenase AlkB
VSSHAQLGLFGAEPPSFDASFSSVRRTTLDQDAWFDYGQGFLEGHEELFRRLRDSMRWQRERRQMYEREVDVPRMIAVVPKDGEGHPLLADIREALSARYGERFERVSLAYYRDGSDSVAPHGDTVARELPEALVATVSVGAPRRFLLHPKAGGRSIALSLGWGDLLVMGGACQRTWQHSIPKLTHADPRISIMFRPVWVKSNT